MKKFIPEPLLTILEETDSAKRRRLLQMLRQVADQVGFDDGVTAMNRVALTGRELALSEVLMVATRSREEMSVSGGRADLSVYNQFTNVSFV